MKGIYLAAFHAYHPSYDIVYQDINGKRDIAGDMLNIDLSSYDFIIATPPCNYYSRAAGNKHSQYALDTKHLLPDIYFKLIHCDKPFIIENVRNDPKFKELGLFNSNKVLVYRIGRHTYWSSINFNPYIAYEYDFCNINGHLRDLPGRKRSQRQGGKNVHDVIEKWLFTLHKNPINKIIL